MRTLTQYKDFFSLLNEDMALSMFRKNLISFNKDGILDKKVAPEELEFTKKNFPEIITAIKSIQSSDKYKKDIGTGDDYLEDKKYLPETLYKKIKSVLTRDSLIKQLSSGLTNNSEAKDEYVSYEIPGTDIVIFIPFTPEANRFLSHTVLTKPGQPVPTWCIAASGARTMWNRYKLETQEYPPVFIFCRKSGIGDVYDDNKYEVVFTRQSTSDAVAGDVSLSADQNSIEWRHPQQTEHGAYWGYNNRFRKTFPEIAGKKVLQIMTSLMKKYHDKYQKINTQFNITKQQSDVDNYIGFLGYLDEKAPGINMKDAVPYAFEYIKNGGMLYADPDLVTLYNDGNYSPEFIDLLYVFINSPLLKDALGEEPTINIFYWDMPDVLKNHPELIASLFKQMPNLKDAYPYTPEIYLFAIDAGILTEQAAVDLFFNKVITNPDFLQCLFLPWVTAYENNRRNQAFLHEVNKKLPSILSKLKKEYSAAESITIINDVAHLYWETTGGKGAMSIPGVQDTINIALKMYYHWVISSEPFTLDAFGLTNAVKKIDSEILNKFCKIWLRIFAEKPEFISYNLKFINRIGELVPSFPIVVSQLDNKTDSKNEIDIISGKLISKFKDGSITLKDVRRLKKYSLDDCQILANVLNYLTVNKFDFSKINLSIDEFFATITTDRQFATAFTQQLLSFFDLHYEELKYFPLYHGVDRNIRIIICAHILETFAKTGKVDIDWCREFFGSVKFDYVKDTLTDTIKYIKDYTDDSNTVLKQIARFAKHFITSYRLYNSFFER